MTSPAAERLFRIVLVVAGICNLALGVWAGLWPLRLFGVLNLDPPRHPHVWAGLAMVVGTYGLLYWYTAWKPDRGRVIVAVGLLGKVLGPVGMVFAVGEAWPLRAVMLCVCGDLIWWLPFSLFLLRGTAVAPRIVAAAPWVCVAVHGLALVAMGITLRSGTELEPDVEARACFIAAHVWQWRLGWGLWMTAAMSLIGFYAWWTSRVAAGWHGTVAVVVTGCGTVCDFSGESLLSLALVGHAAALGSGGAGAWDTAAFQSLQRATTLLTAGAANGLYTIGGILLTLRSGHLPRLVKTLMWTTWISGTGMTVFAITNTLVGLVATTAILFPPMLAWMVWLALRWRPSRGVAS